jgi:hypothetical protein
MKYIVVFLLIIGAAVAGWYLKPIPEPQTITEQVKIIDEQTELLNDSLQRLILSKNDTIARLKKKFSPYGLPETDTAYISVLLPCDTGNVVGQLRGDIATWRQISTIQDTTIAQLERINIFTIDQVYKKNEIITGLNKDVKKYKKQRIKYAGIGVIGVLVSVLLI